MKLIRRLVIFIMILIFLIGLGVLLYPFVKGYIVDNRIQHLPPLYQTHPEVM